MTFREYINETIYVSRQNASKYFKQIQKITRSKTYDIETFKDFYVVLFTGGKEDFQLLVDKEGNKEMIVGYNIGSTRDKFRLIPQNFTSIKDILNDYKLLKSLNTGLYKPKEIIKQAKNAIKIGDGSDEVGGTAGKKQKVNLKELKQIISEIKSDTDLNYLDVSGITDMSYLFKAFNYNVDISEWDVSKVTNMSFMFSGAEKFNSDLSKWDVSKVTSMSYMFSSAKSFNSDISKWDVSKVTDMSGMFFNTEKFNSDLSKWDVSHVTNMRWMFHDAKKFNSDISKWDVSHVTNMYEMFWNARNFNSDLSKWNVQNVTNMEDMFWNAKSFNPKYIEYWNFNPNVDKSEIGI